MKRNIATSPSQSKRLLACGVKPETADMCYSSGALSLMEYRYEIKDRDSRRESYDVIPAWSLSALMALLPSIIRRHWLTMQKINHIDEPTRYGLAYMAAEYDNDETLHTHSADKLWAIVHPSIIECCVEAIEWLTSHGYSLNNIEQ